MARTKKTVSEDTLAAYDDERLVSKFDKRDLKAKVTKGTHLTVTRYSDNRVNLEWDWDALLREVQIATGDRTVYYVDAGDLSPEEAVNLMKTVESKVTKSRSKTVTKKPAAKKATKTTTSTKTTKKKETK